MLIVKENVSLAPLTTFKVGGPAKYFVEAERENDLREAFKIARDKKINTLVLGGGSNIVISDSGFDGLVIKNKVEFIKHNEQNGGTVLLCGSGTPLGKMVQYAAQNSLSGLEWATGIPGSLGGAVAGNAGAFGSCISEAIRSISVLKITELQITDYKLQNCKFGYRSSIFKYSDNLIIVSVTLLLKKRNEEEIRNKMREIVQKRKENLPGFPSAGSFFKNPVVNKAELIKEFEQETGKQVRESRIPAGWLIDKVDLKGKKIGGATVSERNANCIVNTGHARAEDIVILSSVIKQRVRTQLGVQLQEEVKYVGF